MRVQLGFSGEFKPNQWRKGDVDVDEVDFARILADAGLDIDPATVPRRLKFSIMEAEATILIYAMMASSGGEMKEIQTKINEANTRMDAAMERLRGLDGG